MSACAALLARDLRLVLRQPSDAMTAVLFFFLVATLFAFGLGPAPQLLARAAPGILWVGALLAVLLSLERLFQADWEDGALEQMALAPTPLWALALSKILAHWLTSGLPLMLAAPLIALAFGLPVESFGVMLLSLALGTPSLSLIGAIGAALTLGARRGGVLVPLLVLPLYVPVLIFGVSALDASLAGLTPRPHLLLEAAVLLGALVVAPLAVAPALRQALS